MHKKLAADLTSLAHSILQMKNKEDVFALKDKAHEVYEKLSVLAFVEEYINNTPNPKKTKEELLTMVEDVFEKIEEKAAEDQAKEDVAKQAVFEAFIADDVEEETQEPEAKVDDIEAKVEEAEEIVRHQLEEDSVEEVEEEPEVEELEVEEEPIAQEESEVVAEETQEETEELNEVEEEAEEEVEEPKEELILELELPEEKKEVKKVLSLEEELQDTMPVDVVADLFENTPKKSLNDKLHGDIQIGLNDRIAFVKNLFDGSQEDFNRVVSQLNTFKTEKEAKKFINKMVKPDYNWTEKEEFEERFMTIVERKFT